MLLKISLTLAILIGLATLWFTHDRLGGKITDLSDRLGAAETAKTAADADRAKAVADAKTAKTAQEVSMRELNQATNFLSQVTKDLDEQRRRANAASSNLVTVTEERNQARQDLNKWEVLNLPPERVMEALQEKRRLETERAGLQGENKAFAENIVNLKRRLAKYELAPEPQVPPGTKGKVVAVDDKYLFVVLDIGSNQKLEEGSKLLINREGKFVTKVKITHVEPNRSIANIMPEWGNETVIEGDLAISSN